MIQLGRLAGFYYVARAEGYAAAAREYPYPITQAGVHQQVRRLAEEIGVPLFERVGKDRVIPTPAGAALYAFVAPFFERLPSVVREVAGQAHGGTLRIDASPLVLRHLLPDWIARLKRRRPGLELVVEEGGAPDLRALIAGRTDLLLDYLPAVPAGLRTRVVGTVHGFLVVAQGHPICRRKRLELRRLAGDAFVAYHPELEQHQLQRQALTRLDLAPRATIHASTAGTILALVAAGLGYSFVPALDPRGPRHRGVRAFPLARFFDADVPIHAAWRASSADNPLVALFLDAAPRAGRG